MQELAVGRTLDAFQLSDVFDQVFDETRYTREIAAASARTRRVPLRTFRERCRDFGLEELARATSLDVGLPDEPMCHRKPV